MATDYQRVRDYEMMVVFHPELSDEDLTAQISAVEGMITGQGGDIRLINGETPWGRRRLAYPIRHGSRDLRDGIYVLYYFTSVSSALSEVERDIKLDDRVIRYLLTQQGAPMMEPAPEEDEAAEGAEGETAPADETAPAAATTTEDAAPVEDAPVAETATDAASPAEVTPAAEAAAIDAPVEEAAAEEAPAEDAVIEAADAPEDETSA